jgi:hypothetical protein
MISPIGSHLASILQPGGLRPAPDPGAATATGAAALRTTALRPTPDHLALLTALLRAGDYTRAEELLAAVWDHERPEEQLHYLRLWVLAGQGRVLDALEIARSATGRFPGSAAIAYLHAVLERAAGDAHAAVEAALRAAAIEPGKVAPERLLSALLSERGESGEHGPTSPLTMPAATPEEEEEYRIPDPIGAALLGASLLSPPGSARPFRPVMPATWAAPDPVVAIVHDGRRRFIWIGVATVAAALWASRNPLLATAALAATVAWLSRPRRAPSDPE